MRPLRSLLDELVERRLWPFALLLVLALVAVPLLLAKPAPTTDDAPPAAATPPAEAQAAAAAAAPGGEPVVAVARTDAPEAPLRGRAKNPFRQQHLAPEPEASVTSSSTVTAVAPSDGADGTSGGSTGGSGGGERPQQPQTYEYATIDVRFGKAGRPLHAHGDVPRLTPLPGPAKPIVVFLGMRADRETAVFMVSTDVHAQGEGRCVPSRKLCEAIELTRGQIALLDWAEPDGSVTQYELDLVDVTLHQTTSKAVAGRAYARSSRAGRLLLKASVHSSTRAGIGPSAPQPGRIPFRYVTRRGVLHIAPWASERAQRAQRAISHGRLADVTPAGR